MGEINAGVFVAKLSLAGAALVRQALDRELRVLGNCAAGRREIEGFAAELNLFVARLQGPEPEGKAAGATTVGSGL